VGQALREPRAAAAPADDAGDGSCMIVVATDAPLDARALERLAARALFGMGRTGASYSNGSGDFAIAFSTVRSTSTAQGTAGLIVRPALTSDALSPLFQAALEATEEAIYNSLLRATTVSSRIGTAEAIPVDRVREVLRHHRVVP
jgi:D-aminopeptidase